MKTCILNKLFISILICGMGFSTFAVDANGTVVCHNGKDRDVSNLRKHLKHGDAEGSCEVVDDTTDSTTESTTDSTTTEKVTRKSSCDDCTPPIFEEYKLNYTYYNMLNLVSPTKLDMTKPLSLNMTVYESRINHIDVIQFSIVKQPIYYSVNDGFGLVEFHFGWDNTVDKIIMSDEINIISWSNKIISCHMEDCMNLQVQFNYTKEDSSNRDVLNVNTFDVSNNVSNSYILEKLQ